MLSKAKNVLGGELEYCSLKPLTGFYRNGFCESEHDDFGMHCVCCEMTADFLAFSKAAGNDLSTPVPAFNFPGLQPGDRWCVCAPRWLEAHQAGQAPKVVLEATHERTLEVVDLEVLKLYAIDAGEPSEG